MMARDEIIQVLRKARDLLVREGWVQGERHSADGYCLLGALEACGRPHDDAPGQALRLTLGHSIMMWNDAPRRTVDDVLNLIDRTIERLDFTC
jgi:hypothetical protein